MSGEIDLYFSQGREIALERVIFRHSLLASERLSVRGKFAGAYGSSLSFQWTPAVQALAILLIGTRVSLNSNSLSLLAGEAATPASSLDYAIGKQPAWLLDMFGLDSAGNALIRRIIRRTNPERKRGGKCVLSINPHQLSAEKIRVFVDEEPVEQPAQLEMLADTFTKGWAGIRRKQGETREAVRVMAAA